MADGINDSYDQYSPNLGEAGGPTMSAGEATFLLANSYDAENMHKEREMTAPPLGSNHQQHASRQGTGRVFWCLCMTIPVFLGYGVLMKLQSHLRSHLHISTLKHPPPGKVASDSPSAYLFGFCVSCFYIGLMLFRIGHNVFLGYKLKLLPRQRVLMGYVLMSIVLTAIVTLYYGIFNDKSVGLTDTAEHVAEHKEAMIGVLICYFFGGIAVSTYEPNMLSTLTPLGNKNKSLAAVGIPFGTNSVAMVVLFLLGNYQAQAAEIETGAYIFAIVACVFGAFVYVYKVPQIQFEASNEDATRFLKHLKDWRKWVHFMRVPIAVSVCDEFCLAMSVAIGQYIYGNAKLPLLSPFVERDAAHQKWVEHDHFLAFYFFFGFLGAVLSRHYTFHWKRRNPAVFLILSFTGIGLILSKIPLFAPLGMFCIMYGNGAIYATNVRFIDEEVDHTYNLVALSIWMCCGDIGGFCGANAVVPIHTALGTV